MARPRLAIRIERAMTLLDLSWFLKTLLTALLLPPLLPLLPIVAGLLLLRRRPRLGRGLAWAGVLLAVLLSTPVSVGWLTAPLENVPVLTPAERARGQAIVVLAGGYRKYQAQYGQPVPNRLSMERLRYAARVARESGLPLLISGGGAPEHPAEARLMAEALRTDFGLEARWIESRSQNTEENARFAAARLQADGIVRVVLVTHAAHMRRAGREFAAQGLEVIPAPMDFFSEQSLGDDPRDYLPGATAAYAGWYALHEWLGLLAQTPRLGLP